MKQIILDDAGKAKLKAAAGADVNVDNLAVFKADALTGAPVRKKHPVFIDAVHSRSFLQQMADQVNKESLPVQTMHKGSEELPLGRVYSGQVLTGQGPGGTDTIEVLFWIDKTHNGVIDLVNNGTIDQVSVAILGKEALSNKTGFDFMGPDSDLFENFFEGKDDKGNIMGKDGAHVILNNLDAWFEMSLVGRGGAVGAKIKGAGSEQKLHLTLSGKDVPLQTLFLSSGEFVPPTQDPPKKDDTDMDTKEFAALIAENATKVANLTADLAAATTKATAAETRATAAEAELATLKGSDAVVKLTAAEAQVADLTAKLTAQTDLSTKLSGAIFAAGGKVAQTLDADPAKALVQVQESIGAIRTLAAGTSSTGNTRGSDFGNGEAGYVNGGAPRSPYARAPQVRDAR